MAAAPTKTALTPDAVRPTPTRGLAPGALLVGLGVVLVGLAALQVSQGNAATLSTDVLLASRLPRLFAGLLVGSALGLAGATMQGLARNPLASPDTLAVNAGAYLALTIAAAFGLSMGTLGGTGVALVGGLLAAAVVLTLARGGSSVRLVLGGSVVALALASITSALLLMFSQETQGLFSWGAGSLSQPGMGAIVRLVGPMGLSAAALLLLGRRLDLLQLGDDNARSLGVSVARTRTLLVVLSVFLAAGAVTLTGPIGFIGLCAPALARMLRRWVPDLRRHTWLLAASGLVGAVLVIGSDAGLRAVLGSADAVAVPTGVVTTLIGGVFMVLLSRGMRTGSLDDTPASLGGSHRRTARHAGAITLVAGVLLVATSVGSLLLGDGTLLLGDVWNWARGAASGRITFILDARMPRLLAALLAGAALALAGALTQTVTRNPLADPGVLGVAAGGGLGALVMISLGQLGSGAVNLGALAGSIAAALIVFGLSARGGWQPTRLVLVGLGVQAAASALITLLVVATDPWNQSRAITWLGGSTYGADLSRAVPMAAVLVVAGVVGWVIHRELDLIQLDDLTPRLLGVSLGRVRLIALLVAVALTASATAGVGVIGFVGLVAPHAARILVGSRHARFLPLSTLIGALLVVVADTVGRTVLAPAQLPVGLVCALVGVPWFCWLLWRMRVVR